MAQNGCHSSSDCASVQWEDEPPEFIRAPPSFLCDTAFREDFTCSNNEIPFPFHINADGSGKGATLVVALVCALIFTVLLTISGVFLWRNRKHVRKYLNCRTRSPRGSRKGTPSSAASTSDGSSEAAAYTDNIEYKKKALLAAISSQQQQASGVRFLTDSAIRYAANHQAHLVPDASQHHHIYEEIANNYSPTFCQARYAVFSDGTPFSQQAFAQRQSWLDLLRRPPCPDIQFNLYDDGTKITPACPNCYYPSLPRDSTRIDVANEPAGHITVNPTEAFADHCARRNRQYYGPANSHQYRGMLEQEHYQTTQALMSSTVIRNEFPSQHKNLRPRDTTVFVDARTRTLEVSSGQRQHRRHRRTKCTNRVPSGPNGGQQQFLPSPPMIANYRLTETTTETEPAETYASPESTDSASNCL